MRNIFLISLHWTIPLQKIHSFYEFWSKRLSGCVWYSDVNVVNCSSTTLFIQSSLLLALCFPLDWHVHALHSDTNKSLMNQHMSYRLHLSCIKILKNKRSCKIKGDNPWGNGSNRSLVELGTLPPPLYTSILGVK